MSICNLQKKTYLPFNFEMNDVSILEQSTSLVNLDRRLQRASGNQERPLQQFQYVIN